MIDNIILNGVSIIMPERTIKRRTDYEQKPPVTSEILDRLPPQNLEAEKNLLCSLMLDPLLCDENSSLTRLRCE